MTKKRKVLFISAGLFFLIAVFIVFMPLATAKEDFQAYGKKIMAACSCSSGTYNLSLSNTGDASSAYSLSSGQEWIVPYSNEFILKPGQRTNIPVTLNAPCTDSNQTIYGSVQISTRNGLTKELRQEFTFNIGCYDYVLSKGKLLNYEINKAVIPATTHNNSYNICEEETARIPLFLGNKAIYRNSYTSSLKGGFPLWASLNVEQFDLKGKSSGAFFLDLNPPKNSSGIYEFFVSTESALGRLKREEAVFLNVSKCHSLNFEISKEKDLLCYGDKSSYNIILKNNGIRAEVVRFLADAPSWARLSRNNVLIEAQSTENLVLNVFPESNSSNSKITLTSIITITAIVDGTSLNISRQMDIEVAPIEKCYSAALNLPDRVTNKYSLDYKSFKIANNGIRKSAYSLSVEGPSWVSVEPLNVTLNPSQSFNAVLKIEPVQDTAEGTYELTVRAKSGEGYSEKKFTVAVKKKNATLEWIENFYRYNKYYMYLFIVFLIVLFLLREPIRVALSRNYRIKKKRLKALEKAREARRLKKSKQNKDNRK